MKRFTAFAAAALLAAGTASDALAQRALPVFELGVFGGGAWNSSWFSDARGEGWSVGPQPIFGAQANFWTSPAFGVRLNGSFMPSELPEESDRHFGEDDNRALNNYFADLSLVFRPFIAGGMGAGMMSSMYVFAGGGAMWVDAAGDPAPPAGAEYRCIEQLAAEGVCLSYEPGYATVGQGTAGIGVDLFPLGPLGLFAEVATHGYDSPVHTNIDDRDEFSFTTRGVVGLKLGFGNLIPAPVPVAVTPPPPPPPPAPAPAPAPPADRAVSVCVVQGTGLSTVEAMYNPTRRDTTVSGQAFATRYPATAPTYAAGATWFVNTDALNFNNTDYVKFGVTRVIQPTQLMRAGEFQGTNVFVESGATAPYNVVYVPVRPGCEFQPYQVRTGLRPRG